MKVIDVSKYWGQIQTISKRAVIKSTLEKLSEHLEGDEKATGLLKELRALCLGEISERVTL